jgi:hypothetical protein
LRFPVESLPELVSALLGIGAGRAHELLKDAEREAGAG